MKKNLLLIAILVWFAGVTEAQHIETLQQGKPASIRGLSVVNNKIAWVSGSRGTIAITNDGGKTWNWKQVKGFEKSDFRDIEAFSSREAIIMSSGTPALILKTTDGGENWQVKYKNTDTAYFFDAMDFAAKKHGFVLGDPIKGKFVLMGTNDGGETWNPFKNPPDAMPGEACFAASGTCLRVNSNTINIVTGGSVARHLLYFFKENKWHYDSLPYIAQGKSSEGAFSTDQSGFVFVGGDYSKDKIADSIACWYDPTIVSIKNGITPCSKGPSGFQSCVECIKDKTFLSTGTPGSNITTDGGKTWSKIDDASYNVCRIAKHGTLILLAGDHGRIGILKP